MRRCGNDLRGFSLVELLVVMGLMGLLLSLLLPAVDAAREASRRTVCLSNLRNLSLGMAHYADAHGVLPTGYFPDRDPRLGVAEGECNPVSVRRACSSKPCRTATIRRCTSA